MGPSIREKMGLQPAVIKGLSPEEEAAIERQKKKERWAKEKEQKEKERRRKERKWEHAKYAISSVIKSREC
jgi:hypothetical protein